MDETARDEWLAALSATAALYAAMLSATVAGQLAGIGLNALIGAHRLWIPIACSVVFEALAGARAGAVRHGRALTSAESARVSITYSLGLLLLTIPLAIWIVAARRPGSPSVDISFARAAMGLAVLVVATGARWALMQGFAPRRR